MDTGVGLLVIGVGLVHVGLAFVFSAGQSTRPRQILMHMLVDALVLSLALSARHPLPQPDADAAGAGVPLQPITFANRMGAALWPGLFYVLVAAPYVSDLIAVTLLAWIHLNVLLLLQASLRHSAWRTGLVVALPGLFLAPCCSSRAAVRATLAHQLRHARPGGVQS